MHSDRYLAASHVNTSGPVVVPRTILSLFGSKPGVNHCVNVHSPVAWKLPEPRISCRPCSPSTAFPLHLPCTTPGSTTPKSCALFPSNYRLTIPFALLHARCSHATAPASAQSCPASSQRSQHLLPPEPPSPIGTCKAPFPAHTDSVCDSCNTRVCAFRLRVH